MSNFTIQSFEMRQTKAGKPMAIVSIKDEAGAVYENISVWSSHPDFNSLKEGLLTKGTIEDKIIGNKTYKNLNAGTVGPSGIKSAMEMKSRGIEHAQDRKEDSIRAASIIRDSTILTAAFAQGKDVSIDDMKEVWTNWNVWLTKKWTQPF